MNKSIQDYLGDGVYIEFDGYNIILKANHHITPTDIIYLEPNVLANLLSFIKDLENYNRSELRKGD